MSGKMSSDKFWSIFCKIRYLCRNVGTVGLPHLRLGRSISTGRSGIKIGTDEIRTRDLLFTRQAL